MATRTVLVDDLDGGDAEVTVAFAVNGESFSLDLSQKNADKFYAALRPWIEAANSRTINRVREVEEQRTGVEMRQAVRDWARKKGYEVNDRGRIPADLLAAFNKAHKSKP